MAVIERHRTLFQRLTGTGYPAGQKPALPRAAAKTGSAGPRPARTGAGAAAGGSPKFGHSQPKRSSGLRFLLAVAATIVVAAIATLAFTGNIPGKVHLRIADTIGPIIAIAGGIISIALTLYIRSLVLKAMTGVASKTWTAIKDSAQPKSPWTRDGLSASTSETPAAGQPGQASKPPPVFGSIFGFFVVMWFLMPLWTSILRGFGLHKTPYLTWLPMIALAIWVWRRHGGKS